MNSAVRRRRDRFILTQNGAGACVIGLRPYNTAAATTITNSDLDSVTIFSFPLFTLLGAETASLTKLASCFPLRLALFSPNRRCPGSRIPYFDNANRRNYAFESGPTIWSFSCSALPNIAALLIIRRRFYGP